MSDLLFTLQDLTFQLQGQIDLDRESLDRCTLAHAWEDVQWFEGRIAGLWQAIEAMREHL